MCKLHAEEGNFWLIRDQGNKMGQIDVRPTGGRQPISRLMLACSIYGIFDGFQSQSPGLALQDFWMARPRILRNLKVQSRKIRKGCGVHPHGI